MLAAASQLGIWAQRTRLRKQHARADRAFARQQPVAQFDLRTMVIHDTVFGWAGAWGTAVGLVWLAVASGLWIHYALDGRRLGRTSRRPFLTVLVGLLIVGSLLVVEGLLKPGVG